MNATRKRKRAKSPTSRQHRAFVHLMCDGEDDLTQQEVKALAAHPYLEQWRREHFAKLTNGETTQDDEQWLAAELEALVDGREDEEFWRYGGA